MVDPVAPDWLESAQGRRLVVLGADGFIGSWVVRMALSAGAEVVGLVVKDPWRLRAHQGSLSLRAVPGGRWWEARFAPELTQALNGAAALVHLAYEPPIATLAGNSRVAHERRVNVGGTEIVADAAAAAGVPLIFASSADVYGPWHDEKVEESTPPEPATPYASAKLEAEQLVAARSGSMPPTCLRIGTVFGPGELVPRAIPAFIRAVLTDRPAVLHGDGSDTRDYVEVPEVAAAIVNAVQRPSAAARILNLGSSIGRSTLSVLDEVIRVLGHRPEVSRVAATRAPSRLVLSAHAASAQLGFRAHPDFGAAIEREAQWLAANRERWA